MKLLILLIFSSFSFLTHANLPSWRANYIAPAHSRHLPANAATSMIINPESSELLGFLYEIKGHDAAIIPAHAFLSYLAKHDVNSQTILQNRQHLILFIDKKQKEIYRKFAIATSYLLFNRGYAKIAIRPIFANEHAFRAEQALFLDYPKVDVDTAINHFMDPETAIIDGYHIHIDYLRGQKAQAHELFIQAKAMLAEKHIRYSDLDWYPEAANGPHLRAGWEVKFERAGSLTMSDFGYTLVWLMLNHGEVPLYSHAKSWIVGDNEQRLISHLDNAMYSGVKPKLNQRFFFDPLNKNTGLYRWDEQLPSSNSLSKEERIARQSAVLKFWFGTKLEDYPMQEAKKWFKPQKQAISALDKQIKAQFSHDLFHMVNHHYDDWLATAHGRLAAIILLDQFPRNIYRGTPMAFAFDELALNIAKKALKKGDDKLLSGTKRLFLLMPLVHSPNASDQALAIQYLTKLKNETPKLYQPMFAEHLRMAKLHQKTIEKFGAFPSRKRSYHQSLTATEQAFMHQYQADF